MKTTTKLVSASSSLFVPLVLAACASAAPFSVMTPGLESMGQEEAHFFTPTPVAMEALAGTPLRTRVDNAIGVYEAELVRAQAAQGGFLNTTLNILGLVLPISGTAAAIALSDPDQIQTVSIVAGAATTAVLGINLLLKPGAKAAEAARCADFLESAVEAFVARWGPDRGRVTGTQEEWHTYLTMRATLESGRVRACPA